MIARIFRLLAVFNFDFSGISENSKWKKYDKVFKYDLSTRTCIDHAVDWGKDGVIDCATGAVTDTGIIDYAGGSVVMSFARLN